MTAQEAVQRIKNHNEMHSIKEQGFAIHITEALNMGIEALEKQIPEKPDLEGDGYDENGELIYDTGYCPDCRHVFEVYYDAPKHCPDCGKALDWSEEC